jgi:hypothetical protein
MSLFKDCTAAIRQLVADDRLHAREHRGFFTDLDVAVLASQIAGGYDEGVMQQALTEANLALGKAYRAENVVRFGPVRIPGVPLPDHARIATRIVYAAPNGPAEFKTVNGTSSDSGTRRTRSDSEVGAAMSPTVTTASRGRIR